MVALFSIFAAFPLSSGTGFEFLRAPLFPVKMKCCDQNRTASSSPPLRSTPSSSSSLSHHPEEEDGADALETAATAQAASSSAAQHMETHPSSKLPSLRHDAAMTPSTSSSPGVARFFQGLAAGEDLAELIRSLRRSLRTCYHECMRTSAAVFPSSSESASDAADTAAMALSTSPAAPHPLPSRSLSASQRQAYWSASRAAFLFAAESQAATEEATVLHCSPVTRSVLFPYYYPMSGAAEGAGAATLPLGTVLHGSDMTMILSDTRIAELARAELRRDPRNGWQQALRLLDQVTPTALTCALELELYRHTNGHHWAEALRCLWTLPPSQWTEMDVGAVLRSLYHAGRREQQLKRVHAKHSPAESTASSHLDGSASSKNSADESGTADRSGGGTAPLPSSSSQVFLARLIAQALRVHRAVEETRVLQWSTPSALNDTVGLIAQDQSAWREACLLLDKLIAARMSPTEKKASRASDAEQSAKAKSHATRQPSAPLTVTSAQASSALYKLVQPNAVTIHQTCCALQQQCEVGLRYVRLLHDTSSDSIDLFSDIAATEDVLRLCIAGQKWQEALELVTQHQAMLRNRRSASSNAIRHAFHPSQVPSTSARPQAVAATLPSDRQHYRPDVFVQLVRLLGSAPPARPAAYTLLQSQARSSTCESASAASAAASPQSVALGRSKHYNADTLSRAYNCLLQGSDTLAAADAIVSELNHHYETDGRLAESSLHSCTSTAAVTDPYDVKLAGLETESVAHVAYLCCVAGNWERALHHTNALLHAPRYKATFLPTARLHDAMQYALEQAPPPGPSWELSMRLFTDMMERHVPNSEVSFQSVVKRCFAGGAPEQAQKLFHMVLKRGVRS